MRKYKIFVSGVQKELKEEHREVKSLILLMGSSIIMPVG